LPEVKAMVGFGDGEWRLKDVWKHSTQVVSHRVPRLEVRYAALFHDIGKVRTRSISPDGEVHFFGHAEVGARMFDKLERRERLFASEETLRSTVRFLVLHHLRACQYDGKWTPSAIRRFTRELGARLDDLLCLSRADITTKRPEKKRRGVALIDELGDKISALAAEDAKQPPLPTGVGNELMQGFALPPSRLIGDIKRALEAAIESGELEPHLESGEYVEFVRQHRARFGLRVRSRQGLPGETGVLGRVPYTKARRRRTRDGSSSRRSLPFCSRETPRLAKSSARSTGEPAAACAASSSARTGAPSARSVSSVTCASDHTADAAPPAASTARKPSSRPTAPPERVRALTSASRQKSPPPQYVSG
jgi:poly(A) polymerase